MNQPADVVIVGARCAGSPLATLLAREGLSVVVAERAEFPRDTLSTHLFEADALAFLDRLGLTERLQATGAPYVLRLDNRADDFRAMVDWPQEPGDVGGIAAIRRIVLDPILAEAAQEAGADIRMGTKVTGLLKEGGRVTGVRVAGPDGEREIRARLVVGADGRNSTVAGLCGARKYNLTPSQRLLYYGYFEDADPGPVPTFVFHRWADRLVLACPADSGLYLVLTLPDAVEVDRFRGDLERSYMEHVLSCEPVAQAIGAATRVGKIMGAVRWEGFFREASGPGWVLTGDAGHFKDPTAGRGIADAFRQADALAPAIVRGLRGSEAALDRELAEWERWRADHFTEHYWFATDLGRPGTLPAVVPEFGRRMLARGEFGTFMNIQNHRVKPSEVLTPPRLLAATGRAFARTKGRDRLRLLREVGEILGRDVKRRRLNRRPVYAGAGGDAGPTEVD
jgi:flavin-dependent dehydrogenase